jgi:hypothetical protein
MSAYRGRMQWAGLVELAPQGLKPVTYKLAHYLDGCGAVFLIAFIVCLA